jgi:hypothetical protein
MRLTSATRPQISLTYCYRRAENGMYCAYSHRSVTALNLGIWGNCPESSPITHNYALVLPYSARTHCVDMIEIVLELC